MGLDAQRQIIWQHLIYDIRSRDVQAAKKPRSSCDWNVSLRVITTKTTLRKIQTSHHTRSTISRTHNFRIVLIRVKTKFPHSDDTEIHTHQ
jgi:hypothetical protein